MNGILKKIINQSWLVFNLLTAGTVCIRKVTACPGCEVLILAVVGAGPTLSN